MSIRMVSVRSGRRRAVAVGTVVAMLALGGCGGEDGGASDAGSGVEFGASMDEYQEAFADVDEVVISGQTSGAQGSLVSSFFEEYFESVTEWSDGKIQFDVNYANAVAPPPEIGDAIEDGRLDMAASAPTYDPDNYPATNALIDLSFHASQTPMVGTLQLLGMLVEVGFATPEISEELNGKGAHPLIPLYPGGGEGLLCTQPRTSMADFDGASARAGARMQTKQFAGLGMESVSLDFTEMFEGLQRGVIDCTIASPLVGVLSGIFELTPHVTIDPDAGFAAGTGSMVINKGVWDSLPLVARQLLHDRLDVFFKHQMGATLESYIEMVKATEAGGGGIRPMAEDARKALQETNAAILEDTRDGVDGIADAEAFVDGVESASEKWHRVLTEDLGFDEEMSPTDFVDWYGEEGRDAFEPFIERLFVDVLNERRPA